MRAKELIKQGVTEGFDEEAEAWRDWQYKMLPRKMEMLSRLVKGWTPSEEDHRAAIEAGYVAMRDTGDVKDAAKAISDTFNEIQRQRGITENTQSISQDVKDRLQSNTDATSKSSVKPRQDLKHINKVLRDAGYRKLGSGAEAVVWAKRQGGVIKIIMPEDTHDATAAVRTFKKFYDFCQQHQDLENLPRFEEIKVGSHIETFTVDDREYTMIAMERLQPLKSGSMEEALVWMLSDFAVNGPTWEPVRKQLAKPKTWQHWSEPPSVKEIVRYVKNMDSETELRWAVIYNLMRLLYHTGMINKLGWDLHTENIMQRKDGTLVIVDPWFALGTD